MSRSPHGSLLARLPQPTCRGQLSCYNAWWPRLDVDPHIVFRTVPLCVWTVAHCSWSLYDSTSFHHPASSQSEVGQRRCSSDSSPSRLRRPFLRISSPSPCDPPCARVSSCAIFSCLSAFHSIRSHGLDWLSFGGCCHSYQHFSTSTLQQSPVISSVLVGNPCLVQLLEVSLATARRDSRTEPTGPQHFAHSDPFPFPRWPSPSPSRPSPIAQRLPRCN